MIQTSCSTRLAYQDDPVVDLDKLTYAGNMNNLASIKNDSRHNLVHGGIVDSDLAGRLLSRHLVPAVLNIVANSHANSSVADPAPFFESSTAGALRRLEAMRAYWEQQDGRKRQDFLFFNISTDEVYGSLDASSSAFDKQHQHAPSSPHWAGKTAAVHLVLARHIYRMSMFTANCLNNYGPFHAVEQLNLLAILIAVAGKRLPVYGNGQQVGEWQYVLDNCTALGCVLEVGKPRETYNVGGSSEMANINAVHSGWTIPEKLYPLLGGLSYPAQISFVNGYPGHDQCYAIDAGELEREFGWRPAEVFETGIHENVTWYAAHQDWVREVASGAYRDRVAQQYSYERLAS